MTIHSQLSASAQLRLQEIGARIMQVDGIPTVPVASSMGSTVLPSCGAIKYTPPCYPRNWCCIDHLVDITRKLTIYTHLSSCPLLSIAPTHHYCPTVHGQAKHDTWFLDVRDHLGNFGPKICSWRMEADRCSDIYNRWLRAGEPTDNILFRCNLSLLIIYKSTFSNVINDLLWLIIFLVNS